MTSVIEAGEFMKAFQISPLPIGLFPDTYKILVGKPGRIYHLGDLGKWEDGINTTLKK
jgi:hypothetical protein